MDVSELVDMSEKAGGGVDGLFAVAKAVWHEGFYAGAGGRFTPQELAALNKTPLPYGAYGE